MTVRPDHGAEEFERESAPESDAARAPRDADRRARWLDKVRAETPERREYLAEVRARFESGALEAPEVFRSVARRLLDCL